MSLKSALENEGMTIIYQICILVFCFTNGLFSNQNQRCHPGAKGSPYYPLVYTNWYWSVCNKRQCCSWLNSISSLCWDQALLSNMDNCLFKVTSGCPAWDSNWPTSQTQCATNHMAMLLNAESLPQMVWLTFPGFYCPSYYLVLTSQSI